MLALGSWSRSNVLNVQSWWMGLNFLCCFFSFFPFFHSDLDIVILFFPTFCSKHISLSSEWKTSCYIYRHHHHLSCSGHCWQMASTTRAMHALRSWATLIHWLLPTSSMLSLHLLLRLPLARLPSLGVHPDVISWPTWCCSFWRYVLPTVLSCTALCLLYLPLSSPILSPHFGSCLLS